jgi:hypothetical protein
MTQQHSNANNQSAAAAVLRAVPPSALKLPPALMQRLSKDLLRRCVAFADLSIAFYGDAATGRPVDHARMHEYLSAYGRLRIDILAHLGADPQSGEILPLPAISQDH